MMLLILFMLLTYGENINNVKGTVDPKHLFIGLSPWTDGLLDEDVNGAWIKKNS